MSASRPSVFRETVFTAGVRSGDHQLAMVAFHLDADGDYLRVLEFQVALKQWMPCAVKQQAVFAHPGPSPEGLTATQL